MFIMVMVVLAMVMVVLIVIMMVIMAVVVVLVMVMVVLMIVITMVMVVMVDGTGCVNQPCRAGGKQSHLLHILYITEPLLFPLVLLSQVYICFWLQNLPRVGPSPELRAGRIRCQGRDQCFLSPGQS